MSEAEAPAAAPTRRGPHPAAVATSIFVTLGVVAVIWVVFLSSPDPITRVIEIPEGTYSRIVNGEGADIMPSRIELRVGDTLIIRNRDQGSFKVGPFNVGPGATYEQTFRAPAKYEDECDISADGKVTFIITKA